MFIYFDVGNVIVKDVLRLSQYFPISSGSPAITQRVITPLVYRFQKGEFQEKSFWKECERMGIPRPTDWRTFWTDQITHAVTDSSVLAIAKLLRKAGHGIGILSNTIVPHTEVLRKRGIYDKFHPVILSCDVGTRKPEQKIFQIAAEKAQTSFDKIVFVDDVQENVDAARTFGIDAIHYTTSEELIKELQQRALL